MSTAFRGYLYKAVKTNEVFPLQYIEYNTYKSTPNQREELKAYRDDNSRDLIRVTASGMKSTMEHKTRKNLHLADMAIIQGWLFRAQEDTEEAHIQRKIELEYWDNEQLSYKTGTFYIPNIDYKIIRLTDDDIIYDQIELKYIEY